MSSASPFRRSLPDANPDRTVEYLESFVVAPARAAGFWSAVALPFLLFGLVVTGAAVERAPLFAALVAANLLALRLGRDHKRA